MRARNFKQIVDSESVDAFPKIYNLIEVGRRPVIEKQRQNNILNESI
jgi:hypothetical protein